MFNLGSVYPFIFFCMYRFFASKLGGQRPLPQIWAVSTMCFWVNFLFITIFISVKKYKLFDLSKESYVAIAKGSFFWVAGVIILANFVFFFYNNRWLRYVQRFSLMSEKTKLAGYIATGAMLVLLFMFQIFQAYTMS